MLGMDSRLRESDEWESHDLSFPRRRESRPIWTGTGVAPYPTAPDSFNAAIRSSS